MMSGILKIIKTKQEVCQRPEYVSDDKQYQEDNSISVRAVHEVTHFPDLDLLFTLN